MEAGDWIALYAAVVATLAVGWQATTQLLERRPKVRVSWFLLRLAADEPPDSGVEEWLIGQPWLLQIEVLNVSASRSVRISRISIRTEQTEQGYEVWESTRWALPWLLEAGEDRIVALADQEAGDLRSGQHLVAEVSLSDGRTFTSDAIVVGAKGAGLQLVATASPGAVGLTDPSDRYYVARHRVFGSAEGDLFDFVQRSTLDEGDSTEPIVD